MKDPEVLRDEFIEDLRDSYVSGFADGYKQGLMEATKWIPVSDGLPKKGGWYFVTWEDQFKTVRGVTVSEFIEPKGLTDIGHFEGFVLREITAWMPLPEPYKGGDA